MLGRKIEFAGDWSVERIDYRIPYENYFSVHGACLERDAVGDIDHSVAGISKW